MIRVTRTDRGSGQPRGYRVEVVIETESDDLVGGLMDAAREMDGDVDILHHLASASVEAHAKRVTRRMREDPDAANS